MGHLHLGRDADTGDLVQFPLKISHPNFFTDLLLIESLRYIFGATQTPSLDPCRDILPPEALRSGRSVFSCLSGEASGSWRAAQEWKHMT